MTQDEFNKRPLWVIVERKNFNKDLAAWEEHRIKDNVSLNEAKDFIDRNSDRILYAYIPHFSGGGMEAIYQNAKCVESEKVMRRHTKLID